MWLAAAISTIIITHATKHCHSLMETKIVHNLVIRLELINKVTHTDIPFSVFFGCMHNPVSGTTQEIV